MMRFSSTSSGDGRRWGSLFSERGPEGTTESTPMSFNITKQIILFSIHITESLLSRQLMHCNGHRKDKVPGGIVHPFPR